MKYGSLTIGMFLIIESDKLSSFISKSYNQGISIGFIMIGIIMLVYSVSIFLKEFNKKNNEYLEQLEILIEKGATKDNQTAFIEKQNLFIENQELIRTQMEDKTKELDQRLSQIKTNMEIKLDAICESVQDKGIAETDRQHLKETAEGVGAIGRDIIEVRKLLSESKTQEQLEQLEALIEKGATKDNQTTFIEKQNLFIKNQELVKTQVEDKTRELDQRLSQIKTNMEIKLDAICESVQDKGISETDRQHFKETAESVSAIGRDIIQLKNQLSESRTHFLREVQEIQENQVDLKIIPKILCESIDELIKHDETVSEDIREQIRILTESISDQYEELAKKLKSAIEEMEDLLEDYDSLTCEKLEQLSGQYDSFKSLSDKMIEKMSLMASQDLEVIKGIMDNGK